MKHTTVIESDGPEIIIAKVLHMYWCSVGGLVDP